MSDNYEKLLIESYKEQSLAWRHDDSMLHRMTSLLLPISFTALVVPYVNKEIPVLLLLVHCQTIFAIFMLLCYHWIPIYLLVQIQLTLMEWSIQCVSKNIK